MCTQQISDMFLLSVQSEPPLLNNDFLKGYSTTKLTKHAKSVIVCSGMCLIQLNRAYIMQKTSIDRQKCMLFLDFWEFIIWWEIQVITM